MGTKIKSIDNEFDEIVETSLAVDDKFVWDTKFSIYFNEDEATLDIFQTFENHRLDEVFENTVCLDINDMLQLRNMLNRYFEGDYKNANS